MARDIEFFSAAADVRANKAFYAKPRGKLMYENLKYFFSRIRKSASTIREVEGDAVVVVVVMVAGEVDMEAREVG